MPKHGHVHWTELNTREPAKAAAFYASVLGWDIAEMEMPDGQGTYRIGQRGDDRVAGIFEMQGPEFEGMPDHWLSYFAVADADAAASAIAAAGGQVLRPAFDVPGVGRILIVRDATGAVCGMMQPSEGAE
ncbi:MAG: VOC family protein [Pseudomonadota bacterium]